MYRADETSINLRAYFDRMPDEKMRLYSPGWSDEQVVDWCGDFKDDGSLMINHSRSEKLVITGADAGDRLDRGSGSQVVPSVRVRRLS